MNEWESYDMQNKEQKIQSSTKGAIPGLSKKDNSCVWRAVMVLEGGAGSR